MKNHHMLHTPGYVYIMTNKVRTTLYIGVTSNLEGRIWQHKHHVFKNSFTDQYNLEYFVYWEAHDDIKIAIAREKQLKKWRREKKNLLITMQNPTWEDLSETLWGPAPLQQSTPEVRE